MYPPVKILFTLYSIYRSRCKKHFLVVYYSKEVITVKKLILILLALQLLTGCGQNKENTQEAAYMNITAQQAKELMDTREDYVILDTRTQEEYEELHIPGAILIPYDEILQKAEGVLTDKDQLILVYCRSGRRSKLAAEDLVKLGYTNIREFGGIIDWPYETE